jgi:hypothetical protein
VRFLLYACYRGLVGAQRENSLSNGERCSHVNHRSTGDVSEQEFGIVRYGAYEVRLVEPLQNLEGDSLPFWIELFDHKSGVTIDSCGGDLEEAAVGAELLISQAKLLHRNSTGLWSWRRAGKPCSWWRTLAWDPSECLFRKSRRSVLAR